MATQVSDNPDQTANHSADTASPEVVTIELPAPQGWTKKFIPKKGGSGTPRRNEIVFIAPTGDEVKNKRQLDQYLKSHPGGASSSEFDWGTGDTPRRSARLSSKPKSTESPDSGSSRKRQKKSGSKKGEEKDGEKQDTDGGESAEDAADKTEDDKSEDEKDVEMKDAEESNKCAVANVAEPSVENTDGKAEAVGLSDGNQVQPGEDAAPADKTEDDKSKDEKDVEMKDAQAAIKAEDVDVGKTPVENTGEKADEAGKEKKADFKGLSDGNLMPSGESKPKEGFSQNISQVPNETNKENLPEEAKADTVQVTVPCELENKPEAVELPRETNNAKEEVLTQEIPAVPEETDKGPGKGEEQSGELNLAVERPDDVALPTEVAGRTTIGASEGVPSKVENEIEGSKQVLEEPDKNVCSEKVEPSIDIAKENQEAAAMQSENQPMNPNGAPHEPSSAHSISC